MTSEKSYVILNLFVLTPKDIFPVSAGEGERDFVQVYGRDRYALFQRVSGLFILGRV